MFFDLEKSLCDTYTALDPIRLLDYPAEDVFNLIVGLMDYNERNNKGRDTNNKGVIRKKADDSWF